MTLVRLFHVKWSPSRHFLPRIDAPSGAVDPPGPCHVLRNGLRSLVGAREIDEGVYMISLQNASVENPSRHTRDRLAELV